MLTQFFHQDILYSLHIFQSDKEEGEELLPGMESRAVITALLILTCPLGTQSFCPYVCYKIDRYRQMHIYRHPFFRKQCFSLKYVLVAPLKLFGGLSKIGIYVIMKTSVQFLTVKGP